MLPVVCAPGVISNKTNASIDFFTFYATTCAEKCNHQLVVATTGAFTLTSVFFGGHHKTWLFWGVFPINYRALWSTQSGLATLLSFLIARGWVRLQALWRFWCQDLSIEEMVGAWCCGCCQAHRGSPAGFPLHWYSVLFTVESVSLLNLLFISWFICSRRWCLDKFGVFHTNQTSICLDQHLNKGWSWCQETGLSPPVNWLFQGGTSFVDHSCHFCHVLYYAWYPGAGVVFNFITSWSLPSFLLCFFR